MGIGRLSIATMTSLLRRVYRSPQVPQERSRAELHIRKTAAEHLLYISCILPGSQV
jgi:hypothetical protein